jgi:hypothetical protein
VPNWSAVLIDVACESPRRLALALGIAVFTEEKLEIALRVFKDCEEAGKLKGRESLSVDLTPVTFTSPQVVASAIVHGSPRQQDGRFEGLRRRC